MHDAEQTAEGLYAHRAAQRQPPDEILAAAIDIISSQFLPTASAKRRRIYGKVTRTLSALQRRLAGQLGRQPYSPSKDMESAPSTEYTPETWGLLLRRRREDAGLTRKRLAVLSGVADSTIRNIETGRHAPTRVVVGRLQAVAALDMPPLHREKTVAAEVAPEPMRLTGQAWISPGFNPIEQGRELARFLKGRGGRIDPALLFVDPVSAAAWCAYASTGPCERERASMPLAAVAQDVMALLSDAALDLLGLGAGEAYAETWLVRSLMELGAPDLRLLLLDCSASLLIAGFQRATATPNGDAHSRCIAIHGDMHKLPSYAPLFEPRRRRLACLFGDTFSTLDNEATFVRHSLGAMSEDDLLLLDVPLALANPKDEPHVRPGALTECDVPALLLNFLTSPIYRNRADVRTVSVSAVLDHTSCIVSGSYAVEYLASVRTSSSSEPRRFSIYHVKRYELERLVQSLSSMDWMTISRWEFGEVHSPRALLLLQKSRQRRETL